MLKNSSVPFSELCSDTESPVWGVLNPVRDHQSVHRRLFQHPNFF